MATTYKGIHVSDAPGRPVSIAAWLNRREKQRQRQRIMRDIVIGVVLVVAIVAVLGAVLEILPWQ